MDQQAKKHNELTPGSNGVEASASAGADTREANADKRRLLKAGLIGVPLLVTLRSRPAHASSLGSCGIPYGMYNWDGDPISREDWLAGDRNAPGLENPTRRWQEPNK